jgi:hypothetical protein
MRLTSTGKASSRALHTEQSPTKREEIAARAAWLLNEHLPRGRRVRTFETAEVFALMGQEKARLGWALAI